MPQVTEITWIPLQPNARDGPAWAALKKLGPDLRARPGLQGSWHGAPVEMPNSVEFVNVWSTPETHLSSKTLPLHTQVANLLPSLADLSNPTIQPRATPVIFRRPFSDVAAAPIVEITALVLKGGVDKATFEGAWDRVVAKIREDKPEGFIEGTSGWVVTGAEGGVNTFIAAGGWESLEGNAKAHEKEGGLFAEVVELAAAVEVHHVAFKRAGED